MTYVVIEKITDIIDSLSITWQKTFLYTGFSKPTKFEINRKLIYIAIVSQFFFLSNYHLLTIIHNKKMNKTIKFLKIQLKQVNPPSGKKNKTNLRKRSKLKLFSCY